MIEFLLAVIAASELVLLYLDFKKQEEIDKLRKLVLIQSSFVLGLSKIVGEHDDKLGFTSDQEQKEDEDVP